MNREIGVIEKMCSSYGFIQCCERQARLFFHYSQYTGRVEHLKLGDPVEFEMTYDRKTGKPIASSVVKISSGAMFDEQLSQERVSGFITFQVTPDQEGRVVYENRGECFFLPFSECDVENNAKLEANAEVTFNISTDKSGNLRAKCLKLGMPTPAPYKGVVCTLKDRFGFIKRADCDKEIFFHSSGCNNKIFNELNPNDCVEFDIQTRNGKEVAVNVTKLPFGSVQVEDTSSSVLNDYLTRSSLDNKPTCNNSGSISNNSLNNFSNNNLVNSINSNLTNIFDSIGTNSLLSYQQQHQLQHQQQQNNMSTSILSSIINSTLLSSSPPQPQHQQQISWLSKPFDSSKAFQQLFSNKGVEENEDDYPLIDLDTDANSDPQHHQSNNTDSMRYNFISSATMNGNGQRAGIKSDSWSEILTHLPLDLNLQINNDQNEDMNCAMPYRPEKALTKQFNNEESRGPRVVLLRQPRVSNRWANMFSNAPSAFCHSMTCTTTNPLFHSHTIEFHFT